MRKEISGEGEGDRHKMSMTMSMINKSVGKKAKGSSLGTFRNNREEKHLWSGYNAVESQDTRSGVAKDFRYFSKNNEILYSDNITETTKLYQERLLSASLVDLGKISNRAKKICNQNWYSYVDWMAFQIARSQNANSVIYYKGNHILGMPGYCLFLRYDRCVYVIFDTKIKFYDLSYKRNLAKILISLRKIYIVKIAKEIAFRKKDVLFPCDESFVFNGDALYSLNFVDG